MIGFALDAGSSTAGKIFSPLVIDLNKLFLDHFGQSPEGIEIVVTLRVSGEIADFEFRGVDRLRWRGAARKLTMDLGISQDDWENEPEKSIRSMLAKLVRDAVVASEKRLVKAGELSAGELQGPLEGLLKDFLE